MAGVSKHWYVADPIYKLVEFGGSEQCVRSLTAAPCFQRLRRISQLGLASFVFPGAVHTRFSHSVLVPRTWLPVFQRYWPTAFHRNTPRPSSPQLSSTTLAMDRSHIRSSVPWKPS